MILIFGLGNPGKEYENTPHNAGFLVIDKIAEILNAGDFIKSFAKSFYIKVVYQDKNIFLIKPQTFMNDSGSAVLEFKNYFKISNDNIIVVHDDIDLPFGVFKASFNVGSAGHKGIISIINAIGDKNFYRFRVGICPKEKPKNLDFYVTKKISQQYESLFFETVSKVAEAILSSLQYLPHKP